jgi:hypothetical protein
MHRGMSGKCWLPVLCLAILTDCAKHKLVLVGASVPPSPAVTVPVAAQQAAASETKSAQSAQKVAKTKAGPAEVNRLLQEPPHMSFSQDGHVARKDIPRIDKITMLV